MRFIENSKDSLDVMVHYLKKSGHRLEFVLLPMCHAGSQNFYEAISGRLSECDLILMEGVKSSQRLFSGLSYRAASKSWRLNLVSQHEGLDLSRLQSKIIHSDIDGKVFDERWGKLSLKLRLELALTNPVMALYILLFVNRRQLAHLILSKASSDQKTDRYFEQHSRLMGGDRHAVLFEKIKQLDRSKKNESLKVAIPFGAHHMSRIAKLLLGKMGYRVVKRERLVVFDF